MFNRTPFLKLRTQFRKIIQLNGVQGMVCARCGSLGGSRRPSDSAPRHGRDEILEGGTLHVILVFVGTREITLHSRRHPCPHLLRQEPREIAETYSVLRMARAQRGFLDSHNTAKQRLRLVVLSLANTGTAKTTISTGDDE